MGRWQMNALMFFYTLAILVICIVTAVLSLAAYASTRRRFFIYGSGVFRGFGSLCDKGLA